MIWIWIGIGIWVICGLIFRTIVKWLHPQKYKCLKWGWGDELVTMFCGLASGPLLLITVLIFDRKYIFKRSKKMEKVYWNKKTGQLMTKGGTCLWDRIKTGAKFTKIFQRIEILSQKVNKLEQSKGTKLLFDKNLDRIKAIEQTMTCTKSNAIQAQLQCSAKTQGKHKMVFEKKKDQKITTVDGSSTEGAGWSMTYTFGNGKFVFKCFTCGLEITKTKKELTSTEKEALTKLKLL